MTVDVTDLKHGSIVGVLPNLFNEELYCDVMFYCKGGRKVKSHRLLLGPVSPFLQSLFYEQKFRDSIEISLPDINAEDLDIFLRFLYEGVIRLDAEEMDAFSNIKALLQISVSILQQSESSEKILEDTVVCRKRKCNDTNDNPTPLKMRKCVGPEERQHIVSCFNTIIENFKSKENTKCVSRASETSRSPSKKTPLLVPIHQFQTAVKIYERRKLEKDLEEIVSNIVKQEVQKIREEHIKKKKKKIKCHSPNQEINPSIVPLLGCSDALPTASKSNTETSTDILCNQKQVVGELLKPVSGKVSPSIHPLKPMKTSEVDSCKSPDIVRSNCLPHGEKILDGETCCSKTLPEPTNPSPIRKNLLVKACPPVKMVCGVKSAISTKSTAEETTNHFRGDQNHHVLDPPGFQQAPGGGRLGRSLERTPPNNSNSLSSGRGYNLFDSPLDLDCVPSPQTAVIDLLKQKCNGNILKVQSKDGTKTYHRKDKK